MATNIFGLAADHSDATAPDVDFDGGGVKPSRAYGFDQAPHVTVFEHSLFVGRSAHGIASAKAMLAHRAIDKARNFFPMRSRSSSLNSSRRSAANKLRNDMAKPPNDIRCRRLSDQRIRTLSRIL
jgi:hypothetical protein